MPPEIDELLADLGQPEAEPDAPTGPETPPEPEAPAAPPPAAGAPPPEPDQARQVPLATLLEERAAFKARIDALEAKAAAPPPPPPEPEKPEIDFLEDPKAYIDAQAAKAQAALEKLENLNKETAAQAQERDARDQFHGRLGSDEQAFVAKNPDYYDALAHMRNTRMEQMALLYPEATQQQISQAVQNEELGLAAQAMRNNQSPAETAYRMSRGFGYQKAAAAPPPAPGARPAPPAATLSGKVAEIDAARRAAAAATLGASGSDGGATGADEEVDPIDQALQERFKRR